MSSYDSDEDKLKWLLSRVDEFAEEGTLLVFVSRKPHCDIVAGHLTRTGHKAGSIHGDIHQHQRMEVMRQFKAGAITMLVATDVAARGLHIEGLKTVVNYDMARNLDAYVHRIGRTGRAGQ